MKRLIFSLLIPAVTLAQTPTPTPDPDIRAAKALGISVNEVKMQKIAQAINESREAIKTERSGKLASGKQVFSMSSTQKTQLKTTRTQKLDELKTICNEIISSGSASVPK